MLVIGRVVGEVINIGDDIEIKVVETRNGMVRFGVSAPREVSVHRAEVYKRIKAGEKRKGNSA
ncbi:MULTISPECIES: carbon storage regulator CsrA [Pseudomonas]|jgi:carbon storage regulator|uniref:Translational regulator CsrA n=1 Tax=Pseudomonas putida TaxID=303 RepID=A0A379KF17_PSEPU|nr:MULTISPECIES: carbon storage regulator CsrA [Pseudomonas]QPN46751.1 carbon storage regulator CsrA [Priestia aryabhattai]KAF1305183.1 carbon storage regulator [Pseudomonas sp. SG-MS2]MBG6124202.1 carbon storage regulator [Pseudomonas sp. M2]NSX21787.1 carbon storage regulator CsrA [Pseudomonas putida]NWC83325.1 carbon storage regulator CsrA [Pseudomonas putida]